MLYPWKHQRRYNAYSEYFKRTLGQRVQKLTVDAGFTCPNRDGSKGRGGCTYCNNNAFNPSYCQPDKSIEWQVNEGIEFHLKRYRRADQFLVYFQPYSNTYAPLDKLKELYESALARPGVVGLVIGTRSDCVDDEKLEYLCHLAKEHFVAIEYGVESVYNSTLGRINRQHTFEESEKAIRQTAALGLHVGAHFIFGLPGESRQMMRDSIHIINNLPLTSIKFHQMQIVTGTTMAHDYRLHSADYDLFSYDEYIPFIVDITERL
ncbi:MAG: TIGR01212 family radical SAM protein, partial [Bacteroidales bacterium]